MHYLLSKEWSTILTSFSAKLTLYTLFIQTQKTAVETDTLHIIPFVPVISNTQRFTPGGLGQNSEFGFIQKLSLSHCLSCGLDKTDIGLHEQEFWWDEAYNKMRWVDATGTRNVVTWSTAADQSQATMTSFWSFVSGFFVWLWKRRKFR
jgi:hypothetical protein